MLHYLSFSFPHLQPSALSPSDGRDIGRIRKKLKEHGNTLLTEIFALSGLSQQMSHPAPNYWPLLTLTLTETIDHEE